MRRTYRSKKGTSSALNHKDVLQNIDERTSVFDAFYIQNLKQTKRELSCVGSSDNAVIASNKARKRKYVKRLVKEAEPVLRSERLPLSVCLTPDKSIRVNKILDPFDLLLNSSPALQEASKANIDKTFVPKKETKTYVRKRKPNTKKYNYSTDSDKENTVDSNATDIRTHELLVEKVAYKPPKNVDESIIKIIGNLSLINNLKCKSTNGSFNTSYKTRNRLTKNYLSPSMQKSPLCSTPRKEKYRGMSIFNFSPITHKEEMSLSYEDKYEKDDNIIIRNKSQGSVREYKVSPLAIPNTSIQNKTMLSVEKNSSINLRQNELQNDKKEIYNDSDKNNIFNNSEVNNESSCQITEIEPFLGFSERSVQGHSTEYELVENETIRNSDCNDKNIPDNSVTNVDTGHSQSGSTRSAADDSSLNLDDDENQSVLRKSDSNDSSSNNDTEFNDSERSSNVCVHESNPDNTNNHSFISSTVDINENKLESTYTSSNETTTNSSIHSYKCNISKSTIPSQSFITETLYDTCDSDQGSLLENTGTQKEPLIVIERINNSMFLKYYTKMVESQNNSKTDYSSKQDLNQAEKECTISVEKILESQEKTTSDQSLIKSANQGKIEPTIALEKLRDSIILKYSDRVLEDQIDYMSDESLYDVNQPKKEHIIAVEKIRDSSLLKYNDKMLNSQDEEMSESTSDALEGLAIHSDKEIIDDSKDDSYDTNKIKDTLVISHVSVTDDIVCSEEYLNNEECKEEHNRYFSFVTTRRRHEITNDSLFQFDRSYGSSSTDCDKTVLSNRVNVNKSDNNSVENAMETTLDAKENYRNMKTDIDKISTGKSIRTSVFSNKSGRISSQVNNLTSDNLDRENISEININRGSSISRPRNTSINSISKSRLSHSSTTRRNSKARKSMRKLSKTTQSPETNNGNEGTPKNSANTIDTLKNVQEVSKNIESVSTLPSENTSFKLKENSINHPRSLSFMESEVKPVIVLQPGKKWERSLSIYKRMTMINDHFDQSILDNDCKFNKGRKYRQSVINTMEMQEHRDSLHNDSINSRRSTFVSNPGRPTIRFVKDPNFSRVSLNTSSIFDDLQGFLSEECDDTVIELSKLSIADSEREVTILDNFHEAERVTTARDYVLRRCNQTEPILFDECYPETVLKNCHKIGEGVYGEVFLWRGRDGRARVMKIVPIAGSVKVNGEQQKDFHEIISEIVIAMELSALRAPIPDIERQLAEGNDIDAVELHAIENATDIFNEVLAVRCVYGPYPSRLLDLWELYDECKGSENDNPASLPADQRYIVLELANAGQDLESYQFASAQQAHALFQQIAFGLAVAEEAFQFEHRDLHWGNVLIAPTEQKFATFVLRGRTYRVERRGVAATIIDYSLSRLTLPLAADCAALYNDLATDEQLFDAVGDYQFEVYRLMREKLGNDWKNFEPYTNILWLHYIVDKMITALRYKRTNTKIHKHYIEKLKGIKNSILEYGSAAQYVLTDFDI